ncbi:hypothetical protein ABW19_dt0206493 [Dactylella cylindrospora]|nr:hypothetical protein ABW19_dt0206493 [Dactylella cylindrospora]
MDGRGLLSEAQKLESSAGGGFSWFGTNKQDKLELAIDKYSQAANAFRTAGQTTEAGSAFERAAALSKQINEPNDAANYLTEAFKCYRRDRPQDAARCMTEAINHYALTNVRRAATNKQTLGEMMEQTPGMEKQAIVEYEQAGAWFANDNADALANKCFIKVAELSGTVGDYQKAITKFEEAAKNAVNHNLLRWSVKEYLFKAGICHLGSKDNVTTRRALMWYAELDPSFAVTMEGKFLGALLAAVENQDAEEFNKHIIMFKENFSLDQWKLRILSEVAQSIESAGDDLT